MKKTAVILFFLIIGNFVFAQNYSRFKDLDTTSAVYFSVFDSQTDSLNLFLPFDEKDFSDYAVSSFGIRAAEIVPKTNTSKNFHLGLYDEKINEEYPWQIFWPLLICFLAVLASRFYREDYIPRLFLIIFYRNAFINAIGEKDVNADKAGLMLFINFIFNVSLLATAVLYRYDYKFNDFLSSYLLFTGGVFLYYSLKKIITLVLAKFFSCEEIFSHYYSYISYLMHTTGLCLLILNLLCFYVTSFKIHQGVFFVTVFVCISAEVLKIFRLFFIIFEKRFPIFYLFLYLCAVEFLPIVLSVKFLSL